MLKNKTVIVSGVGPGLGREIATFALRDGANVVMGARTEEKLEKTAAELDASGARIAYRATDVTDADGCRGLVEGVPTSSGRLTRRDCRRCGGSDPPRYRTIPTVHIGWAGLVLRDGTRPRHRASRLVNPAAPNRLITRSVLDSAVVQIGGRARQSQG